MNLAFMKGKSIGQQFHLESSPDSINHLLQNCADYLTEGPYVQRQEELSAHAEQFSQIQGQMELFLDRVKEELGSVSS